MKVYLYILTAICLLSSCEKTITEFQAQNFIKFFGSGIESKGNNVIVADPAENSYLFVGYDNVQGNNNILAVKTDKFGNTVWENIYQDSAQEESAGTIIKKAGDDFIIIGTIQVATQANPSASMNPKLMKINSNGDIVWKSILTHGYKLIINDFIIVDTLIIVAGESYKSSPTVPQCFYACFNTAGVFKWEYPFPGAETFKKIFLNNNGKLILVGNSSISSTKMIKIVEANVNGGTPVTILFEDYPGNTQIVRDAIYKKEDGILYLLTYDQTANRSKVNKFAANYTVEWTAESPLNFSGESLTLKDDGTFFILCENNDKMTLVKVDSNGDLYSGDAEFKNLASDAGAIISTPDNGLIIVGSTTSAFGTMVQLIKTDKDLYLLKP